MSLIGSLGLDSVESDPNHLPDSTYAGEIKTSEYVYAQKKNTYNHVITYRVTDGNFAGRERQEWFNLGTPEFDEDGAVTKLTPPPLNSNGTDPRSFYKARLEALGVTEEEMTTLEPADLVGKNVYFTVRKNGSFINVTNVKLREADATQSAAADF